MSGTAICTDSSALLPASVAERFGIEVVPISITLGDEPFDERAQPIDDFYERLSAGAAVTTSQPSPADFADAYARLAARGARAALSIHLDARVSGTTSSAELAAREASLPVSVVDTKTVSFGVGVCVRAAGEAVAAGGSASDAAAAATGLGAAMRNVFVAHGGPGGRVPELSGWTVLAFVDGTTLPVAACESVRETVDAMAAQIRRPDEPVQAAVGHAGAVTETAADALADELSRLPHVLEVERYRVGAAVGAHTGPVTFGAFWWPAGTV
jgi:DegV family protein with EDD domain